MLCNRGQIARSGHGRSRSWRDDQSRFCATVQVSASVNELAPGGDTGRAFAIFYTSVIGAGGVGSSRKILDVARGVDKHRPNSRHSGEAAGMPDDAETDPATIGRAAGRLRANDGHLDVLVT